MPAQPGQQPRPSQRRAWALGARGEAVGGGLVGGQGLLGAVRGLEGAGPGQRQLGRGRIHRGQVQHGAERGGGLRGPPHLLQGSPQTRQRADAKVTIGGRRAIARRGRSGHQAEVLDRAIELPGGPGGLGEAEPGARQGLAGREMVRQPHEGRLGLRGSSRPELGGHQVGQGELGDVAAGIGGQVPLQGRDGLGVAAGLDVPLSQQELRIGGGRPGRLPGQPRQQFLGVGRPPERAVG